MSTMVYGQLNSQVSLDAEPQFTLSSEETSLEYETRPELPSLRTLNPPLHLSFEQRNSAARDPYQECNGQLNIPASVPEEAAAAAACAYLDPSAGEARFSPEAASGASLTERSTTQVLKASPQRSLSSIVPQPMSSRRSVSSAEQRKASPHRSVSTSVPQKAERDVCINRSVSALSFRSVTGEETMHLPEEMAYHSWSERTAVKGEEAQHSKTARLTPSNLKGLDYYECKGVNGKLFRVYYKDMEVSDEQIPVRFKGQYDIALLYADADLGEAMSFKKFVERFCRTDSGEVPKVCTIDYNPDMMEGSKIQHIEDAMRISTYVFLYITKNFCTDRWSALQKDECLMASLHDPDKRWCIVPVLTQKRGETNIMKAYDIPFGLQALKPIDISRITHGECLIDLMRDDPEDGFGTMLTEREVRNRDRFFLNFFNQMLSRKIPIRKARESQVAMAKEMFIDGLKKDLAKKEAQKLAEEDARNCAREQEKKSFEAKLKQSVEDGSILQMPTGSGYDNARSTYRESVAQSEGGPSYHYHFHNSQGIEIPAMPVGKQTTVNVQGGNIVQVGDYNTATALTQDEEDDIYVPDNDVPLRRHVPAAPAPKEESSDSDSECGGDMYQSHLSNKEALFCQEEFARQSMMEEAKSVGYDLDEIQSAQGKEEASIRLKHMSFSGSTHPKDTPGTELDKDPESFACSFPPDQAEEWAISATDLKNMATEGSWVKFNSVSSNKSAPIPTPTPAPRHIHPAQGSPTEDDSRNILPKLYIQNENDDRSSNVHRDIGDIDTSQTPNASMQSQDESIPSLSQRVVYGQESDVESVVLPSVDSKPSQDDTVPGGNEYSILSQMSSPEDVVEKEKKEAQSEFHKQYFKDLCGESQTGNSDDLYGASNGGQLSQGDSDVALLSATQSLDLRNSFADIRSLDDRLGPDDLEFNNRDCLDSIQSNLSSTSSIGGAESDFNLSSLQEFIAEHDRDVGNADDTGASESFNERENTFDLNSLKEFIEEESRDMQRERRIQMMEVDGGELPNFYWSIKYAYPHHIDSQFALGHPITQSINSLDCYIEDYLDLD